MHTETQQKLIDQVKKKVQTWFKEYPVTAHGYEHATRVYENIQRIGEAENARSLFLCELSALLHDIGRVPEHYEKKGPSHHELSYDLLRIWFREEAMFDVLSGEEKIELLYTVRYHWNDCADEYDTAWMLRDADKLDGFGDVGLQRLKLWYKDEKAIGQAFRLSSQMLYDIRTETAKKIIEDEELMKSIIASRDALLKKGIKPITL